MHFDNDSFEDHVQFDDLLKFWYDPDRIPIMPLKASERITLEPPDVKRFMKRKKVTLIENMKFICARKLCYGNDSQRERSSKFIWQLKRLHENLKKKKTANKEKKTRNQPRLKGDYNNDLMIKLPLPFCILCALSQIIMDYICRKKQ